MRDDVTKHMNAGTQRRIPSSTGFTLTELLITVSIIGILASMAIPQYRKSIESSYWRAARDILLTIYTGERVYSILNGGTFLTPLATGDPNWPKVYMDDPNVGTTIPVTFEVQANGGGFLAIARRGDGRCMSIDDAKNFLGMDSTQGIVPAPGCTALWNWYP